MSDAEKQDQPIARSAGKIIGHLLRAAALLGVLWVLWHHQVQIAALRMDVIQLRIELSNR